MTHIANWKITGFNGNIHYFDWAIFQFAMLIYQRLRDEAQDAETSCGASPAQRNGWEGDGS